MAGFLRVKARNLLRMKDRGTLGRFVIFGRARTGTSLLVSLLDSHHQIRCEGEVFHRKKTWALVGNLGQDRLLLESEKNPRRFADLLLSPHGQERIVGFKMLNNQARSVQEYVLSRSDIKKIVVYRHNVLSVFASSRIAKATGQWGVRNSESIKSATVTFDPNEFSKFVRGYNDFYNRVEQVIRASRSSHIRLEYGDIAKSDSHKTILEFLGADPALRMSSRSIKLSSGPLENRFTNWDQVVAALANTEMEEWLREN